MLPPSWSLTQEHVCGSLARNCLEALVAQRRHLQVIPEILTRAKKHRPDRKMQFVDEPGAQVLTDRCHTTTEADVTGMRRSLRPLKGNVDPSRNEVELRGSSHSQRL